VAHLDERDEVGEELLGLRAEVGLDEGPCAAGGRGEVERRRKSAIESGPGRRGGGKGTHAWPM